MIICFSGCDKNTSCEQSNPESNTATAVPSPLYSTLDELKIPVSYTSTTFVTASIVSFPSFFASS